ncbi:MAG: hypothetical protein KAS32_15135, partial [Candidatus Peribacteraceae bacterium]|nr:hypothetical protein [Candidatus Peribacteraceae bacterium]
GILVNPSSAAYTGGIFLGNNCSDDQGTATQQYGIRITQGNNYIVASNSCFGNTVTDLYNSVENSTHGFNEYRTSSILPTYITSLNAVVSVVWPDSITTKHNYQVELVKQGWSSFAVDFPFIERGDTVYLDSAYVYYTMAATDTLDVVKLISLDDGNSVTNEFEFGTDIGGGVGGVTGNTKFRSSAYLLENKTYMIQILTKSDVDAEGSAIHRFKFCLRR